MDLEKNNKYYNEFQIGIGKHASPNHDIKTSLWKLPLWFYHKNITKRLGLSQQGKQEDPCQLVYR
jgi:hypothetical protein